MIKLIATDMDGTLLRDDKTYNQALFLDVFKSLKQKDIKFVVASGNQYAKLRDRFEAVKDEIYYVAENGAIIANGNKILFENPLTNDVKDQLLWLARKFDYHCVMSGEKVAYVRKSDGADFYNKMKIHFAHLKSVDSFEEVDDTLIKFSFNGQAKDMTQLAKYIRENFPKIESVTGDPHYVDLQNRGVNKALGLEYLSNYLNIKPEEILAFGDGLNDLAMLEYVGTSIVTSVAIPETRKVATKIIGSNNDDAVLHEIEKQIK